MNSRVWPLLHPTIALLTLEERMLLAIFRAQRGTQSGMLSRIRLCYIEMAWLTEAISCKNIKI